MSLRRLHGNGGGGGGGNGLATSSGLSSTVLQRRVRKFDAFRNNKVRSEYREKTIAGGATTLVAGTVMVFLFFTELWAYLNTGVKHAVVIDPTVGEKIRIDVNISFPKLTCLEVNLVSMDVAGELHIDIDHHMYKERLDGKTGLPLAPAFRHNVTGSHATLAHGEHGGGDGGHGRAAHDGGSAAAHSVGHEEESEDAFKARAKTDHEAELERAKALALRNDRGCGDCFGAPSVASNGCCNTCSELRDAYDAKGWNWEEVIKTAAQCAEERLAPHLRAKEGEGCRIHGYLEVNKVAGNFHVALGTATNRKGRLIHRFTPTKAPKFDASHEIHELRFRAGGGAFEEGADGRRLLALIGGKEGPGPLDGHSKKLHLSAGDGGDGGKDVASVFHYYLKIIPEVYTGLGGEYEYVSAREQVSRMLHARSGWERVKAALRPPFGHGSRLTYTYSLQETERPVIARAPGKMEGGRAVGLPGVFFVYDFSSFLVRKTEEATQPSFLRFLTRICAVVGGVFTVAGLIDSLVYHGSKAMKKD